MAEIFYIYAKIIIDSTKESELVESQDLAGLLMDRFDAAKVGRFLCISALSIADLSSKELAMVIVPLRQYIRTSIAREPLLRRGYEPYMQCWAQLLRLFIEVHVDVCKLPSDDRTWIAC